MKIFNLKNFVNFFGFIFTLIIIAIWSSMLFFEWGTDYGGYYSGSFFLSEDYRMYNEYFEHKGPLYYLFLKCIGSVIGWGHLQAYIALFLSVLLFFIVIFYILIKQGLSPIFMLSGISMSLLLLYGQNTNSSIVFFQASFTLLSFYLLLKHDQNEFILILAFSIFALSVFTRIDSIVYLPIYLFAALYYNGKLNLTKFLLRFFWFFLIFFIIFQLLSRSLNFNLNDFITHNINFNSWYKTNSLASHINRPTHFALLTSSLIVIPVLLLRNRISEYAHFFGTKLTVLFISDKLNKEELANLICIAIFIISSFIWIYSGSDKDYYLLLFSIPIVFLILFNLSHIKDTTVLFIYFLLTLYPIVLTVEGPLKGIIKDPSCVTSHLCASSPISNYSESIKFLNTKSEDEVNIIGGRGWTYFFSSKRPARSINDWWLYTRPDYFQTEELIEQHNKLLLSPKGELFLIDNVLLRNIDSRSDLLDEILSSSELVEKQQMYSIYKIIKSDKN